MRAGDDLIYVFLGLLELERLMICALVAVRLLAAPIVPCNGPNVSTAVGSKLTVPINRRPVAGIADVSERESLELRTGSVLKVNRQNCFLRFTLILQSVSSERCFMFFFETHFPLVVPSPQECALPPLYRTFFLGSLSTTALPVVQQEKENLVSKPRPDLQRLLSPRQGGQQRRCFAPLPLINYALLSHTQHVQ